MRKLLLTMLAAATVCACSDLKDRVDTLEKKVAALEASVNENASSISQLAEAAKKAVTISKVEETADGYKVYFSDGTTAVLTNGINGTDGKDAVAPVVGIKEYEGDYYWTIDGEFILNGGAKVPVSGKTPQFKIQDSKWYVSYDGSTWAEVPVTGTVKPEIVLSETDNEYVFTLGETVLSIPKEKAFMVKVKSYAKTVLAGDVLVFSYTVVGADSTTHVIAESKGVEAEVNEAASTVTVTVPSVVSNAYVMIKAVRNSDGKYSAQYINIQKGDDYGTFGGLILSDENEYLNW